MPKQTLVCSCAAPSTSHMRVSGEGSGDGSSAITVYVYYLTPPNSATSRFGGVTVTFSWGGLGRVRRDFHRLSILHLALTLCPVLSLTSTNHARPRHNQLPACPQHQYQPDIRRARRLPRPVPVDDAGSKPQIPTRDRLGPPFL